MPLIEAQQLTKRFRVPIKDPGLSGALKHLFRPKYVEKTAVNHIDLAIHQGESVAYIGPNGAGKSTTIKMLTGILSPTEGTIRVCDLDPHRQREEYLRKIGVVFGQRTQLWWDLPVQESLRLLGDIYDVPKLTFEQNLREYTDLFDLGPLLRVPARQLSLGQRMRCDLAAALLHNPAILFLDEPTIGLDVSVKDRMRKFIKHSNRERGVTIMLTSHDLQDIENICERIVLIDKGEILFDGPLSIIRQTFGNERIIHLTFQVAIPEAIPKVLTDIPHLKPIEVLQPSPSQLVVHFDSTHFPIATLVGRLLEVFPVSDLRVEEVSIEAIVLRLYDGVLLPKGETK